MEICKMVPSLQRTGTGLKFFQKKTKGFEAVHINSRLTLRGALAGFVLMGLLIAALGVLTFVKDQHRIYQESALERAVKVRLNGIELGLGRALNTNWEQLNFLAQTIPEMTPEARRAALDVTVGDGNRVAWVGLTSPEGVVLSSSNGLLEGESVAELPWFQKGFQQDYAGDKHGAILLNELLNNKSKTPIQFIDLARPIVDGEGNTIGVLGMHIKFDWVIKHVSESAIALGMNAYLVNEAGQVVLATDGAQYDRLDLASIRSATAGFSGSQLEVWPDHRTYFTSVLPRVTYGNLPGFGWRIVGRIDPNEFTLADSNLINNAMKLIGTLAVSLLLITVLFCRIFIAPIEKLAHSAMRNAHGADEYPFKAHQTVEISRLSTALAILQGRQDNKTSGAGTV